MTIPAVIIAAAALSIAAANPKRPEDRFVAADAKQGVAVYDVFPWVTDAEDASETHCKNEAFGGFGETLLVITRDAKQEEIELVGFGEPPCATKASAATERAGAREDLLVRYQLDIDKGPAPKAAFISAGKPAAGLRVESHSETDEDDIVVKVSSRLMSGNIALASANTEYNQMAAGQGGVSFMKLDAGAAGGVVFVQDIWHSNMRGADDDFRVVDVALPSNGVDVAGLAAIKLPAACRASVASNAALVHTVAATVAQALGDVPVTAAKAERPTSIVYATPACVDAAKLVAAKVPGGAGVEPLTWKTKRGVVVALGATAAIKR